MKKEIRKSVEKANHKKTFREKLSNFLYNFAFSGTIAVIAFLIGWIYVGGGDFFFMKGWNPAVVKGFEIIIDLLLIGLNLFLGAISLKTLWFLYKEGKEGRSYFTFMTNSKYGKILEVIISVTILGGLGSLFVFIGVSRLITILF